MVARYSLVGFFVAAFSLVTMTSAIAATQTGEFELALEGAQNWLRQPSFYEMLLKPIVPSSTTTGAMPSRPTIGNVLQACGVVISSTLIIVRLPRISRTRQVADAARAKSRTR